MHARCGPRWAMRWSRSGRSTPPAGQGTPLGFSISFAKLAVVPDPGKSGGRRRALRHHRQHIQRERQNRYSESDTDSEGRYQDTSLGPDRRVQPEERPSGRHSGPEREYLPRRPEFFKTGGSLALSARSTETGQVTESRGKPRRARAGSHAQKGTSQGGVYTTPISLTLQD